MDGRAAETLPATTTADPEGGGGGGGVGDEASGGSVGGGGGEGGGGVAAAARNGGGGTGEAGTESVETLETPNDRGRQVASPDATEADLHQAKTTSREVKKRGSAPSVDGRDGDFNSPADDGATSREETNGSLHSSEVLFSADNSDDSDADDLGCTSSAAKAADSRNTHDEIEIASPLWPLASTDKEVPAAAAQIQETQRSTPANKPDEKSFRDRSSSQTGRGTIPARTHSRQIPVRTTSRHPRQRLRQPICEKKSSPSKLDRVFLAMSPFSIEEWGVVSAQVVSLCVRSFAMSGIEGVQHSFSIAGQWIWAEVTAKLAEASGGRADTSVGASDRGVGASSDNDAIVVEAARIEEWIDALEKVADEDVEADDDAAFHDAVEDLVVGEARIPEQSQSSSFATLLDDWGAWMVGSDYDDSVDETESPKTDQPVLPKVAPPSNSSFRPPIPARSATHQPLHLDAVAPATAVAADNPTRAVPSRQTVDDSSSPIVGEGRPSRDGPRPSIPLRASSLHPSIQA
ncbi:hypothetical protein DFJ73DRAFT_868306 [Zopfochytrium polystomum]|nr:hypothetical protein DFJ73DRAFT_868306 [Zopfochytrium polystomum]